jgi:hypothetical protein
MLATPFVRLLNPAMQAQTEHLQALLDFRQMFQASETRHIFPLLARYDLDMPYQHLQACYRNSQVPTVSLDRGHITGSVAFAALRQHLLSCLEPLIQAAPAGAPPGATVWLKP